MNGQFLMNKAIKVQYAFKKDTATERHGTEAERLLAAQARKNGAITLASAPPPPTFLTGECRHSLLTMYCRYRMNLIMSTKGANASAGQPQQGYPPMSQQQPGHYGYPAGYQQYPPAGYPGGMPPPPQGFGQSGMPAPPPGFA